MEETADFMVILISNDGVPFKVSRDAIKHSRLVERFLSDDDEEEITVPLLKVGSDILPKIIAFCEHHRNEPVEDEMNPGGEMSPELSDWDRQFLNIDQAIIFELIMASNYLDLKILLIACCKVAAGMIQGESPKALCTMFNHTREIARKGRKRKLIGLDNDM